MILAPLPPPPPLDASRTALFLDIDGTIAEIAPHPGDVGPDPARTAALQRLVGKLGGRLAVLTGRTLEDVDRILEASVPCVGAVHGLVRRGGDGEIARPVPTTALQNVRDAFRPLVAAWPGLIVEDKEMSVALHFRQQPQIEPAVTGLAARLAREGGLVVQHGAKVVELRIPGPHKGDCLKTYLLQPPFRGHLPVMVGDDLTDEHAFESAREAGGYGVLVGPARSTHAQFGIAGVRQAMAWLAQA